MDPVKKVYVPVKNVRVVPNTPIPILSKLSSPQTSQNSEATSVTNNNYIVNGSLNTSTSTQKLVS